MVALLKLRPSGLVSKIGLGFALWVTSISAQPIAVGPRWQATFPAAAGGDAAASTAVLVEGQATLVAIVASGADASRPRLLLGNQPSTLLAMG